MMKVLRYIRHNLRHSRILRVLLASLLLGFVLPLLVLNMLYLRSTYSDMEEQAVQSYETLSRQVIINLDNIIEGVGLYTAYPYYNSFFETLLTRDYNDPAGYKHLTSNTRDFGSNVHSLVIRYNPAVYSALLYNARSDVSFLGGYASSEPLRQQLLATMSGVQSKEHYGYETRLLQLEEGGHDASFIVVGRPLYDTGSRDYLGFFALVVRLEDIARVIESEEAVPGVRQYIVDEQGTLLYSADESQIGLSMAQTSIAGLAESLDRLQQGGGEQITLEGRRTIVTCDSVNSAKWRVISTVDADTLFAGVNARQRTMSLLFFLLALLAIVLVGVVAVWVARPIRGLRNTIREIERGHDFSTRVPVKGTGEVAELGAAFNTLLEEIQRLLAEVVHREEEKRAAEMAALQAQVNPHFLGNTLNTIKWMANMQCADNISEATDSLIHLMNYALDTSRKFVTVREELEFTKRYVALMRLRYYGAFEIEYDFAPETLNCLTLRFVLQPLVDNAIFHGFQNHAGHNLLAISGVVEAGRLVFHVRDNGVGIERETILQVMRGARKKERGFNSIGVYNVHERIRLNHGGEYGIYISSAPGQGTDVQVTLPAETQPPPEGLPALEGKGEKQ